MAIGFRRFSGRTLGLFALSVFFACAPAPQISLQYGTELKQAEIKKVLAENPLGASENIKITTLGQGQGVSHHVVQIRDRENPHLHKLHDGTVVMVKGHGYLVMENRRIDLVSRRHRLYPPRRRPLLCQYRQRTHGCLCGFLPALRRQRHGAGGKAVSLLFSLISGPFIIFFLPKQTSVSGAR